ncbi:MAG: glycosyltransferase family 2 protein [Fibrobacterales bacterium]
MTQPESLAIVIPCYNEESMLPITVEKMTEKIESLKAQNLINDDSKMYLVDDGSKDKTWEMINQFSQSNKYVVGVKLSRNQGHQNALMAGLFSTIEDMTISIDADLQDDVDVMDKMIQHHYDGCEIVYGTRSSRKSDTFFKRFTAEGYYKLLNKLGVEVVFNHADYRFMSRVAIRALSGYKETNLFLRGIIPQLGYKTAEVSYSRAERVAGESKYPLSKMLRLAWQGVTSFSNMPLRFVTSMGVFVCIVSVLLILWVLYIRFFTQNSAPGWASTLVPLFFIGGVQLLGIGIIGEYIGKIYSEIKARPRYFVEKLSGRE